MKKPLILAFGLLLASGSALLRAQTSTGPGNPTAPPSTPVMSTEPVSAYGPMQNDNEFSLSGGGSGDKHFNNSQGSLDLALGHFLTDSLEVVVRQTASYDNPPGSGALETYSTRIALDENFFSGPFRPFAGINLGGIYGDGVQDSFTGGLEGGVKLYVKPKTFVFALLDYSFLFRSSNQVHDRFHDGAFFWDAGVGFNF
jgi:hypothetical protein